MTEYAAGRRRGLEDAAMVCRKLRDTQSNLTPHERTVLSLAIAAISALETGDHAPEDQRHDIPMAVKGAVAPKSDKDAE